MVRVSFFFWLISHQNFLHTQEVFEKDDSPNTTLLILNRYLTEGNLYDPSILKGILRDRIGDITFKEAYNVSRLILNIAVSSDSLFDMPSLLNYMTSPDVVSKYQHHFNKSIIVLTTHHCRNKVIWSAVYVYDFIIRLFT